MAKIIVDRSGVTSAGWFGTTQLAWGDITHYRLSVRPEPQPYLPREWMRSVHRTTVEDVVFALRGRGTHTDLTMYGSTGRVKIGWRADDASDQIRAALHRLGPTLLARARDELARSGVARFGRLRVSGDELAWPDRAPIARAKVARVEVAHETPLSIVIARNDGGPVYAGFPLDGIPNVLTALEVAEELGYAIARGERIAEQLRTT